MLGGWHEEDICHIPSWFSTSTWSYYCVNIAQAQREHSRMCASRQSLGKCLTFTEVLTLFSVSPRGHFDTVFSITSVSFFLFLFLSEKKKILKKRKKYVKEAELFVKSWWQYHYWNPVSRGILSHCHWNAPSQILPDSDFCTFLSIFIPIPQPLVASTYFGVVL